jgi:hypothetical protein
MQICQSRINGCVQLFGGIFTLFVH